MNEEMLNSFYMDEKMISSIKSANLMNLQVQEYSKLWLQNPDITGIYYYNIQTKSQNVHISTKPHSWLNIQQYFLETR